MRLYVTVFVILISTYVVNASLLEPVVENIVHYEAKHPPSDVQGIWKKKTIWKPRWVKEWKSSKVTKPVWRKIWSPVHIKEWVPIPKPPPGWETKSTRLIKVKTATDAIPFWDPMPYPESQQPPPPSRNIDNQCGGSGCDDTLIKTFTEEQIADIIGSHRHKKAPEYSQSAEHSEMMAQLAADSENWRLPRQSPFQENRFNLLQDPSQYLVPPKYQSFVTDYSSYLRNHKNVSPHKTFQPSTVKPQRPQVPPNHSNSVRNMGTNQWTPIQSQKQKNTQNLTQNKPTNLFNKFQAPNNHPMDGNHAAGHKKPDTGSGGSVKSHSVQNYETTTKQNLHVDTGFIQQADLIGEYHYSDFDFHSTSKPNTNSNFKHAPVFKPLPPTTNSQPIASMKFKPLPKETSSEFLQEPIANPRVKPTAIPKFKPLVSETASPPFAERIKQNKPPMLYPNATKPRPTRKDAEYLPRENEVIQQFTPKPEIIFEQEKAITKEILQLQESTPNPFPVSHRFGANLAFKPPNGTGPTNSERTNNVEKNFHLYFVYPEGQKNSKDDSEENLLKALQKNPIIQVRTNNVTETRIEKTTSFPLSTSSSTTTNSKIEVATKSPVFIVTPTYVHKS